MEKKEVVADIEVLRKKWDRYTPFFHETISRLLTPICSMLLNSINLKNATSILEVGCGSGEGIMLCDYFKPQNAKLTAADLSSEMLKLARERLPDRNIEFVVANAEELPFPDQSFDCFYANFCLHLVPDPDKMLKETKRVLKIGSFAAFSVWGRPEKSPWHTLPSKVLKDLGLEKESPNPPRSSFHLHDLEKLKKRVLDCGFSKVRGYYTYIPVSCFSGKEFVDYTLKNVIPVIDILSTKTTSEIDLFKITLEKEADEFYNKGEMIGMETAVIVAQL